MKFNFQDHAKIAGMTMAEVGVLGGGMIVTSRFLDFNVIFKNQIAADPNYVNKWHMKHQGAIKLVVGALAAAYIKNPWLKLLAIGVAVEGFIREARVLTTDSAGTSLFDKIGNTQRDQENAAADARLAELARAYEVQGPANQYGSTVGNSVMTLTRSIPSYVAGPVSQSYGSTVGANGLLQEWRMAS